MVALRRPPPRALERLGDALWYVAQAATRPRVRADCEHGPRPCPWVSCRYHALSTVSATGTLQIAGVRRGAQAGTDLEPGWIGAAVASVVSSNTTCALDSDGMGVLELAAVLDRDRERIRVITASATSKLEAGLLELGVGADQVRDTMRQRGAVASAWESQLTDFPQETPW